MLVLRLLRASTLVLLTLFAWACSSSSSDPSVAPHDPVTDVSDVCQTPLAPNEPVCSEAFSDALWAASHRSSYAQGSSALAGPTESSTTLSEHIDIPGAGIPVVMSFSSPYEDGGRAIWSTVPGLDAAIMKIDHDTFEIIDWYVPSEREDDPPTFTLGLSGAYNAVDTENQFIVGRTRFVSIFGDSVEGDRSSPAELKKRIFMPDEVFCDEEDLIAGMTLTYDGQLAFVTELGNLFVISPDADPNDLGDVPVASANDNCTSAEPETLEIVSNSLAADEDGGIYVLTSEAMYRFDWDGSGLSRAWRAAYDVDEDVPSPIRLGPGSGSTPSLMGTGADDDQFVVITDGQALMNLVLFWRDEIPDDWEPIAPGKDPRIACEIPIDFGTGASEAISEQSVAVRGYSAVVVNDLLTNPTINPPSIGNLGAVAQNLVSALEGGIPEKAPFGFERVDWDPVTRTCATRWANADISVPNGIPSISETAGLVYGAGQRDGQWGLEGLDWETGESRVWVPAGPGECPGDSSSIVGVLPGVEDVRAVVPDSCENSIYAATTVGPDGTVYQGTLNGVTRYVPESVAELTPEAKSGAGVDQGLDLITRSETAGEGAISERDYLRRAIVQLSATQTVAVESGLNEVIEAVSTALRALDAAVEALDASAPHEPFVEAARLALESLDAP
jgi:hypothetical protein